MFGVLREKEQTIPRVAPLTPAVGFVSGPDSQRRRQTEFGATNGLEMKCFNEDGLMWIGAARNGILIRGVEPIESTI